MSVSSGSDVTIPMQDSPPPPPSPYANQRKNSDSKQSDQKMMSGVTGIDNGGYTGIEISSLNKDQQKRTSTTRQTEIPMNEYSAESSATSPPRLNEAVNTELVHGMNVLDTIPHKPQSEFGPYEKFPEYFISVNQHKKFLRRGEKLSVTKDKRKGTGKWKKFLCWALGGFLLVAIITVAVLAAVGLIPEKNTTGTYSSMREMTTTTTTGVPDDTSSSISGSSENYLSSTTPDVQDTLPVTEKPIIPVSYDYVPNAADIELTLKDAEFVDDLSDPTTSKYKDMAAEVEQMVKEKLEKDPDVDIANAHVTAFLNGSIITKLRISWSKSQLGEEEPDFAKLMRTVSTWKEIGNYTLPSGTTRFYKLHNSCKVLNGGCSDSCVFDEGSLEFMCTCPEDKLLDEDKKTCAEVPLPSPSEPSEIPTNLPIPLPTSSQTDEVVSQSSETSETSEEQVETRQLTTSTTIAPTELPKVSHEEPLVTTAQAQEEYTTGSPALPAHSSNPYVSEETISNEPTDSPALPAHSSNPDVSEETISNESTDSPALPAHSSNPAVSEETISNESTDSPDLPAHSSNSYVSEETISNESTGSPALPAHSSNPVVSEETISNESTGSPALPAHSPNLDVSEETIPNEPTRSPALPAQSSSLDMSEETITNKPIVEPTTSTTTTTTTTTTTEPPHIETVIPESNEDVENHGITDTIDSGELTPPDTTISTIDILDIDTPKPSTTRSPVVTSSGESHESLSVETVDANPLINTTTQSGAVTSAETVVTQKQPSLATSESESHDEETVEDGITILPASTNSDQSEEVFPETNGNSSAQVHKSYRSFDPSEEIGTESPVAANPSRPVTHSEEFMIYSDNTNVANGNSTTTTPVPALNDSNIVANDPNRQFESTSYENGGESLAISSETISHEAVTSGEQRKSERLIQGTEEIIPIESNGVPEGANREREREETTTHNAVSLANDTQVNESIDNATEDVNSEAVVEQQRPGSSETVVEQQEITEANQEHVPESNEGGQPQKVVSEVSVEQKQPESSNEAAETQDGSGESVVVDGVSSTSQSQETLPNPQETPIHHSETLSNPQEILIHQSETLTTTSTSEPAPSPSSAQEQPEIAANVNPTQRLPTASPDTAIDSLIQEIHADAHETNTSSSSTTNPIASQSQEAPIVTIPPPIGNGASQEIVESQEPDTNGASSSSFEENHSTDSNELNS